MARTKRKAVEQETVVPPDPSNGYQYQPGGPVAALHADLAQRLAADLDRAAMPTSPAEALVQFTSRAGGYALLAIGYAATATAIIRWL